MVDAGWIRRRRCGARERHIDVLEVRAEIGVFRIELRRAYVVAVRGAGRPGQHSATRRVIREDTETPLTTTNCKHQKRHQKQSQSQQPSRCAFMFHRRPPVLSGFPGTSLSGRSEAT